MRISVLFLSVAICALQSQVPQPPLPQPGPMQPENPLFDFGPLPGVGPDGKPLLPAPMPPGFQEPLPDLAPIQQPQDDMTPGERHLMEIAIKVAPSVVALRVWDEFGDILSAGVGCFVNDTGMLLTDAGLLHPEFADRIDYITTTAADGRNHRVTGWYVADLSSGVALLQSEATGVPALKLRQDVKFDKPMPCHLFAVSEKRGLVLADARVEQDQSLAGQGWLNVRGDESPGAPGSPILDTTGQVVAIVSMKVPLKSWMNFALPASMASYESQRRLPEARPLSSLPKTPKLRDVTGDAAFLGAYQTLTEKKVHAATRKLLALTRKYPRSAECWTLLGLSCSQLGAASEAVNCQRKAVALDPRTGLYWHQLASAQLRQTSSGTPAEETLETLEQATLLRPTDAVTWYLLATRALQEGKTSPADNALRQVIKLEPDFAPAFYLLGYVRTRLKDDAGAVVALDRCLQLDDRNADAWFLKGLIFDKQKAPLKAVEAYSEVVRLQPKHPHAWQNLARAHQLSGNDTAARLAMRERMKHLSVE
ncbi:MAG: tetratricopeptide repeat protein [Verrucomicrobiaceae bacterium]|nr:tetratricopeptide repeat protein [Verrucomicrobiaceae bacterium]